MFFAKNLLTAGRITIPKTGFNVKDHKPTGTVEKIKGADLDGSGS
jgi:hypothetical protein